jgi:hypothetical protein
VSSALPCAFPTPAVGGTGLRLVLRVVPLGFFFGSRKSWYEQAGHASKILICTGTLGCSIDQVCQVQAGVLTSSMTHVLGDTP